MKRDRVEDVLRRALGSQSAPRRMEQTAALCAALVRERGAREEPRRGFWGFLSDVFRFDAAPILAWQALALLLAGLHVRSAAGHPEYISAYMPLFVLAAMPVFFRGQYHRVSEIEAATRSSGAQLVLARLVLAGGAGLLCATALLWLEVWACGAFRQLGRMILYCLVPYLVSVTAMLYFIRREKSGGVPLCAAGTAACCGLWRVSARACPWLYEIPAVGVWVAACVLFAVFFAREIYFIIRADREGKMYGTVV